MNSMNGAPTPHHQHNQPPAFEQALPVDIQAFTQDIDAYIGPKIDNLRSIQEHNAQAGTSDVKRAGPKQGLLYAYASERYHFYIQRGYTSEAASQQAQDESEQRYGIQAQINELEQVKAGALSGNDALPLLHMVGAELAEKRKKLKETIQRGREVRDAPMGTLADDEKFIAANQSIITGEGALSALESLPDGDTKTWLLQTAQARLSNDRYERGAHTERGKAMQDAHLAQAKLNFLTRLLENSDKMRRQRVL